MKNVLVFLVIIFVIGGVFLFINSRTDDYPKLQARYEEGYQEGYEKAKSDALEVVKNTNVGEIINDTEGDSGESVKETIFNSILDNL